MLFEPELLHGSVSDSEEDKVDWMTLIDTAIEGVPEKAEKRRKTVAFKKKQRVNNTYMRHIVLYFWFSWPPGPNRRWGP